MPTSSQLHSTKIPRGMNRMSLRDLLLLGGAGQASAEISIPYMNMLPGTTEPYAQGVQQIVKGLQRMLRDRGVAVDVDGGLGEKTQKAIMLFAGPKWYEQTWAQLYMAVLSGERWKGYARAGRDPADTNLELDAATNLRMQGMGGFFDDVKASPLAWAAVGVAGYLLLGHYVRGGFKARRRR